MLLLGIGIADLSGLMPPMHYPEPANTFMEALLDTKYVMFIVSVLKIVVGASLLSNRYVPFALVVFFPITVNMVLFHAFLNFEGIVPAAVIGILHIVLLADYIDVYRPLLQSKSIHSADRLVER
ncbi:hypothetical protein VK70_00730 [Paenibacillus durus ATCC 35681]|uniref:DoxX family protein n=1 Tax=Paenibacillus durus ATCC 35681 TaxID=1333534 RepID=A0A0F7FEW8_PAEDU|nr:hypothetical protein VK70_00730 [Paenibacillus durus ATCC 35681]